MFVSVFNNRQWNIGTYCIKTQIQNIHLFLFTHVRSLVNKRLAQDKLFRPSRGDENCTPSLVLVLDQLLLHYLALLDWRSSSFCFQWIILCFLPSFYKYKIAASTREKEKKKICNIWAREVGNKQPHLKLFLVIITYNFNHTRVENPHAVGTNTSPLIFRF